MENDGKSWLEIVNDLRKRVAEHDSILGAIRERLGRVEDSVASSWHVINENKDDLKKFREEMREDMNELREDMKDLKAKEEKRAKDMKFIKAVVSILAIISIGFFIYIWRNDKELAMGLLTLSKTLAPIPAP